MTTGEFSDKAHGKVPGRAVICMTQNHFALVKQPGRPLALSRSEGLNAHKSLHGNFNLAHAFGTTTEHIATDCRATPDGVPE
jgi:hypothetical protein